MGKQMRSTETWCDALKSRTKNAFWWTNSKKFGWNLNTTLKRIWKSSDCCLKWKKSDPLKSRQDRLEIDVLNNNRTNTVLKSGHKLTGVNGLKADFEKVTKGCPGREKTSKKAWRRHPNERQGGGEWLRRVSPRRRERTQDEAMTDRQVDWLKWTGQGTGQEGKDRTSVQLVQRVQNKKRINNKKERRTGESLTCFASVLWCENVFEIRRFQQEETQNRRIKSAVVAKDAKSVRRQDEKRQNSCEMSKKRLKTRTKKKKATACQSQKIITTERCCQMRKRRRRQQEKQRCGKGRTKKWQHADGCHRKKTISNEYNNKKTHTRKFGVDQPKLIRRTAKTKCKSQKESFLK